MSHPEAKPGPSPDIARKVEAYKELVARIEGGFDKAAATLSHEAIRLDGTNPFLEYQNHLETEAEKRYPDESKFGTRTPFQIDRDRILYSSFFMPLALKTQMIIGQHTSVLRNRLSHTLFTANIARGIAQAFDLNDALTEAIALGHDLGHAPFGHTGEQALNKWLERTVTANQKQEALDFAQVTQGEREHFLLHDNEAEEDPNWRTQLFRHGRQSVKKLEILEHRSCNLTRKTLFGIWRHSGHLGKTDGAFNYSFSGGPRQPDSGSSPGGGRQLSADDSSYETQVVRLSDDIAAVVHDLDDAIRVGCVCRSDVTDRALLPSDPDNESSVIKVLDWTPDSKSFVGLWVRKFISGVVEHNKLNGRRLDKALCNDPKHQLTLSKPLGDALVSLRGLVKEMVHKDSETLRAEEAVNHLLSRLADRYWATSANYIEDLRRILGYRGQTESGLNTLIGLLGKRAWSTTQETAAQPGKEEVPPVERAALICDFLSALTDEEAVMLWEWHYSPRFRLAPAFVGAGQAARSTRRKEE